MKTITLKYRKTLLLISILLLSSIGYSQTSQTFTSSGSFTAPAGVTSVQVQAWGGGGKGGSRTSGNNGFGGGGGGAYAKKAIVLVTPGVANTVVVGTGATTNTAPGQDSYFINTLTVLAKGGATVPVNNSTGGAGGAGLPTSIGDIGSVFAGGNGANGVLASAYGGGGGSSAGTASAGTSATNSTGATAPSGGGNGGNGRTGTTGDGIAATTVGGGGGGSYRNGGANTFGGNGANGQVIITWTCPTYALTNATTATGPFCGASASTVTLSSTSLPSGTYTVTYNLSGATSSVGNTATMTYTAGLPGSGTFSTSLLAVGTTTVTITNLASGTAPSICSSAISTNNTVNVTVNSNITASVAIAASATTVCNGTSVTFTATPTNGGTTPNYQWQVNGTNVGSNSTTYTSTSLANSDVVTCILTSNATPCLIGSPATSNSITMTITPSTIASVSISASATTVCTGSGATFTATPTNGGTTPSYQWKLNGTNVGTNSTTYTAATLANSDAITCVMTSNATPCLVGSPATSNTITITVNPIVTASVSIAATATTICAATSVTFTATPTNGGASPAYQWKINGTNVGTNSATYTTSTLANGDAVTCVMTSNASCVISSPATSNTITMTITPSTPASVSISASATTVCSGTSVTFTATPTNGGTTPSYQWKVNGANVGTNSTTYTSSALTNGNTITCVLTSNATPCLTGSPATSNTITMTVNPIVTASVSIAATATTICAATSVTFTATPTNGGATPTYQWKLNGINVGTNSATYSSSTLANNDTVTCVMTSNASCVISSPATSNTITMTVNPYLTASVSVNASATTICSGTNVTFTATPTNGGTSPAYQWVLNGSNVGTNSSTYSSTTLTTGDQVICILTSNATPCLIGSPATSNTITMTVNTTPSITSTTPGNRTGTGTVVLGATASAGTVFWYTTLSGGGAIASGNSFTTPSISATTTYYAEAYTSSGCASSPRTAVTATIYAPEMDVQGNSISIVDGDASPAVADWTDFNGASTRTFTIYNTGTGILNIGAITFGGTNGAEYTLSVPPSASVAAGGNTSFTVQFTPTAAGTRVATISIVNDDANENPYNFSIQGTGTAQEINIQGNATNIVNNDATPSLTDWTDFSNVTTTRTFTIQNLGSITLGIIGITFTGLNPGDFSVIANPSATVAGRSTTTFTVKFTPGATGARSAIINIDNTDSNENPYIFTIQGNTTSINMNVKGGTVLIADGDITPSTNDFTDFGSTNVSSPITRTFTVENTGTLSLNLTGTPKVVLTGSTDFSVTTQPSSPIVSSGTTTFIVTFNPTSIGSKTASISIANNDAGAGKNPYTFDIKGMGIQSFIDSDGDGVYNHLDSDDDNDGIPDNVEQSYASGSVLGTQVQVTLLNETFGAGTTRGRIYDNVPSATTTYCWEDGTTARAADECDTNSDVNDGEYTVGNSAQITSWASTYWYTGVDHTPSDTNGKMGIFNATNNVTEEFYRTTLQGVITNAPLTYSFWVLNLDRSDAPGIDSRNRPNITVEFRDLSNNLISSINTGDIAPTTAGNAAGNWFQFSRTFTPTTTGFTVVFRNNQLGGSGNDLALDDILIIQKLTDSDQDGIADAYDLDSDNDGIGDINEDQWTSLSNGKDRMDLGGTWIDANGNGFHDTAEAFYVSGSPKNFDGDAVPNYIDLDSDNDSIFDTNEAGLSYGDGDVNDDGVIEGTDTDADGILSSEDALVGFGNNGKVLPTNTLGAGNPDYINLISKVSGVYDIANTLYANLDTNNDGKIDGATDIDRDGILDAFDTNTAFYGSPRDLNRKLFLDFDGRNDYGQGAAVLGGLPSATLMAWVDLNSGFTTDGVVIGQTKFQLMITGGRKLQAIVNGNVIKYNPIALNYSQWYHVAAVYDGSAVKLYLNGEMVFTGPVSGNIAADASLLTIGKDPTTSTNYFKGKIDEVRVFNVALTDSQVQRMVYQEIQNSSTQVRGTIVPVNVGSLPFTNVLRYYRMDTFKNDIVDDLTTAAIDSGTGMKIYNHKNIYAQQAPMPFITERTGSFATAVNSPTNDVRGQDIMDYDYSIVQVKHDITETANCTDLGMIVDAGKTVTMNNDTKLQNDWYLLLNGKVDLQGKSQLVQTTNSILDASSAGSIERDQQGQSNKYNYNYWSSPVSTINSLSNNNGFTVNGVLRDGTNPNNIQNITWTSSYNGAATSPITLSSYWIFKFQNLTPQYANWSAVGQNGTLLAAQGFTLKGSNAATATQNYTFVGKPNNGTITTVIAPGNLNLCGNPYPSALDADAFITANSSVISGSLYFWEHYSTNSSHNLLDYQGGYAARSLVGGTPPVAPAGVSGLGSSTRVPSRYIPVGQGFLVYGNATGGTITFNNNQRAFVKENDPTSNIMFRQTAEPTIVDAKLYNKNDAFTESNTHAKIRLGYVSAENYHRQLLLGFMDDLATDGFDVGYDAPQIDNQPSDVYFALPGYKLVIEGAGAFAADKIFPLTVKTGMEGPVKFMIDNTENFDANQNVYIYDNVTNTYHEIRNQPFEVSLPIGTLENRFSLRFTSSALGVNDFDLTKEVAVTYTNNDNTINIKNNLSDTTIKSVELYNMLGQSIKSWDVKNDTQVKIQIPINNISTGTYIVKVHTSKGDISKKIIIQ